MSYIKRIELADKLVLFICKLLKINRKHLCFQVLSNFSDKKFTERMEQFDIKQTDCLFH